MTETRQYHSPLRRAEAASTRARILDASAALFASHGFALTAIKDIASNAGVSVQTVHLAGPKSALLLAAYDRATERAAAAAAADTPTDAIRRAIGLSVRENEAAAALWQALVGAAHADAQVRGRLAELVEQHDATVRGLLDEASLPEARRGMVAAEVSFLLSAGCYLHFVEGQGWPVEQFRAWLELRVLAAVAAPPLP